MIHQAVTEPLGNRTLKLLDLGVLKFNYLARLYIDQVVVVAVTGTFIARPTVTEIMPLEQIGVLKETDRSINRRQANSWIEIGSALIDNFDIGMVI